MISPDFISKITTTISTVTDPSKFFIFGSATRKDHFNDVDLGSYDAQPDELDQVRDALEESTLPYFFDVVNFNTASRTFLDYVEGNEKLLWLK